MQIHKMRSKSDVGRRAWNILRLALLWARKGGVFVLNKRLHLHLSHFIKSLRQSQKGNGALQYGDRQLSFNATPMIHVKMHRPNSMRFRFPHIPCINPHHIFHDFDDHSDYNESCCEARQSFLIRNGEDFDDHSDYDDSCCEARQSFLIGNGSDEEEVSQEDQGIDLKAERFIANFYEQLKLQRQFNTRRRSD